MTNEQIIFSAAQQLAEAGAIKYTGKVYKARDAEGNEIQLRQHRTTGKKRCVVYRQKQIANGNPVILFA